MPEKEYYHLYNHSTLVYIIGSTMYTIQLTVVLTDMYMFPFFSFLFFSFLLSSIRLVCYAHLFSCSFNSQ